MIMCTMLMGHVGNDYVISCVIYLTYCASSNSSPNFGSVNFHVLMIFHTSAMFSLLDWEARRTIGNPRGYSLSNATQANLLAQMIF